MTELAIPVPRLANGKDLPLPIAATDLASGVDLLAAISQTVTLSPGQREIIPTGISISLPLGYEAQVRPRSGLAVKYGIGVVNSPGTIDADYRGEIGVIIINHGDEPFVIKRGMRIAQLVVSRVTKFSWTEQSELTHTNRGDEGFGATGVES